MLSFKEQKSESDPNHKDPAKFKHPSEIALKTPCKKIHIFFQMRKHLATLLSNK